MNTGELLPGLDYESALKEAQTDQEGWNKAKTWVLEDYLVRRSGEVLQGPEKVRFDAIIRNSDIPEQLITLGEEYHLLENFDLQTESLRTYCRQHGKEPRF